MAVLVGVALGSVLVTASPASAATTVGKWELNEAPGAKTAVDSSGYGQNGTVGSDISTGVKVDGATAYRWPTWDTDHINHEVIIPHNARLNPDKGNFSISVRLRTARVYSNVVQKGQNGTPG